MKTCLICQASLPLSFFAPLKSGRGGLHPWCKECVSEYNRSRYHSKTSPRAYRPSSTVILPYKKGPNIGDERSQVRGRAQAANVWYRLLKKRRVPHFVDFEDTVPIYALAEKLGMTVDHIIPVGAKDVSGLHVPWNLQLVTRSENSRKGVRYTQPF